MYKSVDNVGFMYSKWYTWLTLGDYIIRTQLIIHMLSAIDWHIVYIVIYTGVIRISNVNKIALNLQLDDFIYELHWAKKIAIRDAADP